MKTRLLTIYFAFCSIFGGVLLPNLRDLGPVVLLGFGIVLFFLAAYTYSHNTKPAMMGFFIPIWAAMIIVSIANGGIHIVPLVFNLSAAAMFFVAAKVGEDTIKTALSWAGWFWLLTLPILFFTRHYLDDPSLVMDRNIVGFWGIIFTIAALTTQKKWYYALPFIAVTILSTSRGGVIGLTAAVLVFYRPRVPAKQVAAWVLLGCLAVFGLIAMRPASVATRIPIYYQSIESFLSHPVYGVGVNGLYENKKLTSVRYKNGNFYQPTQEQEYVRVQVLGGTVAIKYFPHAHNGLINYLAETGLVGLAGLGLGLWWLWRNKDNINFKGWQWAIIGGTLVHSLVDWPLWYYGPLVVFMAVAGTVEKMSDGTN